MNPEQLLNEVNNIERAMTSCRYTKAVKLLQAIRIYGRTKKASTLRSIISIAIEEAGGHYVLDVLRSLAKIRNTLKKE